MQIFTGFSHIVASDDDCKVDDDGNF